METKSSHLRLNERIEIPETKKKLRQTGIDVVGDMPWGTHFCQFYQTKQDLLDILVPYFIEGLKDNEYCVWVTCEFLTEHDAWSALKKALPDLPKFQKKGQIEIFPYNNWYLKEGKFELNRVLGQWVEKHNKALAGGYEGLRVSGNPFWIDNKKDWNDFAAYEAEINNVIDNYKILVLCTYSLDKCGSNDILDVVTNHQFALIKREAKWELIESSIHKKTEEALRASEEKFKIIATHTPDHIMVQDENLRYTMVVNPQLGFTEEDMIGKTDLDILLEEDAVNLTIIKKRVLKTGKPECIQVPLMAIDGSVQYFEGSYIPKYNAQGDVDGIIGYFRNVTERIITEKKLNEEKEFINTTLNIAGNLIVVLDNNARIVRFNKTFEQMMGYSSDEVLNKSFIDIFLLPEEKKLVKKVFDNLVEGYFPNTFENYWVGKDGKKHLILWSSTAMIDESRKVKYIISSGTDISERKQIEETLAKNQKELQTILDTVPAWIFYKDKENRFLRVNKSFAEIMGMSRKDLEGKSLFDLYPKELAEAYWIDDKKVMASGKPKMNIIEPVKTPKGELLCQTDKIPYRDAKGNIIGIIGFTIDITERMQAEKLLIENEARLKRAQEIAHLGSWELDVVNNNLTWSDEVYRIFGLQPREFKATYQAFIEAVHHSDRIMVDIAYSESLKEGRDYEIEHRIIRKNGEIRYVHEKCTHIKDKSGKVIRSIGMVHDITERIKVEEKLRESEEKYRELVSNANSIIVKMGTDGRFTFFNEFALKFFGFNEDEIIGKTALETIVPQFESSGRDLQPMLEKLYKDPDEFSFNINENIKKNGERVWIEWHNKSLFDNDGNRIGHMAIGMDITERIMAEIALQKNSERLEILSDTASQLLASNNPKKIVNQLCARVMKFLDCHVFFNYIVDENAGKLFLNTYAGIPAKAADSIGWLDYGVAVCGCVARDGVRIIAENIPDTPDLRTDLVKSFGIKAYACHPLLAQGKVIGTLSFGTKSRTRFSDEDITMMKVVADQVAIAMSRIKAERELYDTKNYLENLINYANAPIIVWNPKSEIQLFNNAFERLTGYLSSEVIGKKLDFLFPKATLKDSREKITQSLMSHWETVEIPILCKNNEIKIVLWNSANIYDIDDKTLISTIAQGNDITQRKTAEKELKNTKNYLENLINYANAPIIVWNTKSQIQLFNKAFEHLTGYTSGEVTGKRLDILFPKETLVDSKEKIEQSLLENWETIEIPILCKNKEVRTVLWNSANIYDEDGKTLMSTIAQGNDITERKNAEAQLQKTAADLKDLNSTKDKFFNIIAHDLKNPFSSMLATSEILSKNTDQYNPETIRKFTEIMYNATKSGYSLLENLLEWSRSQTGNITYNPQKFNFREIVEANISNIRISADNKKIKLKSEITEDLSVVVDKNMLNTILRNLLNNAMKFTHEGGEVTIKAEKNNSQFIVTVKDTGIGIPKKDIDKLFRIDVRYSNIGTAQERGTGLGLLLCKEFVEKHGGIIWVESIEGKGSEFKFTIH